MKRILTESNKNNGRQYIALFISSIILTACTYANFGQQAYDWVEKKARQYSKKLSTHDLGVRWRQIENVGYGEISHAFGKIDELLQRLHKETKALDTQFKDTPNSIDALKKIYDQSLQTRGLLFDLLFQFEAIQERIFFLDAPCERKNFDRMGLKSVADYSLLESLIAMSERAKKANQDRYGLYIGYTFELDENGDPEVKPAGGKEQLKHFLKSISMLNDSIFAFFNEDKIKEQDEKLNRAIDLFFTLTLTPDEVYAISKKECEDMVTRTDLERQQVHLTYTNYRKLFDTLQQLHLERQTRAYLEMLPMKILAIDNREGFSQAYAHIIDQQKAFTVLESLDKEINYILNMRLRIATACPDVTGWSYWENYKDGLQHLQDSLEKAETDVSILHETKALWKIRQRVSNLLAATNNDRSLLQAKSCQL